MRLSALLLLVAACAGCGAGAETAERPRQCPVDLRAFFASEADDVDEVDEADTHGPTWSPDGTRIAVVSSGRLLVVRVAACTVEVVRPEAQAFSFGEIDWSPDSEHFAVAASTDEGEGLYVMRVDGGGVRRLTQGNALFPDWSPDGARIAFVRDLYDEVEATEDRNVWIVGADGTGLRRVTTGPWHGSADWHPDGEWLVTDEDTEVIRIRPDGSGREVLIAGEHSAPSWSPDGSTLVLEGPMLAPGAGGELKRLNAVEGGGFEPAWAPDGQWIALTDGVNSSDLWVVRPDGSGARQLTRGDAR